LKVLWIGYFFSTSTARDLFIGGSEEFLHMLSSTFVWSIEYFDFYNISTAV